MLSVLFSSGISLDPLSVFFAILIASVFIPVFIYTIGYVTEYTGKYSKSYNIFLTLLFVVSMILVSLSNDGITFMIFWEVMSASSFFLVIYEYRDSNNIRSGIMYFIMTHVSGFFLMVLFGLFYKWAGTMNFSELIDSSVIFNSNQTLAIVILAIMGFGAKAGFVPLHAWLPKAHPSATSNASALMSGLMLKVSLYGFIRVMFYFLKEVPLNLAIIVTAIGVITAIFGILNALVQKDIKKLLAYSSAENIGIILSALGLSLVLKTYNMNLLSALSLMAALFHILNHAVFKSLLFTSAGSVLFATGTKNMNELGGLHKKMKFAAICAFIGTASISALPPFNGFASEFLILKSYITASSSLPEGWTVVFIIFAGALSALTSGGAVYTSIKSYGITYLGSARSEKAEHIHKIPVSMNIGLGILAVACLLLGVLSPYILNLLAYVPESILYINRINIQGSISYEITIIALILLAVTTVITVLTKVFSKVGDTKKGDTWGCGFNSLNATMQYSGNGLSQPITRLFSAVVGYSKKTRITSKIYIHDFVFDIAEKYIYEPIVAFVQTISKAVVKIHMGKVQVYLMYLFFALLATVLLVYKLV